MPDAIYSFIIYTAVLVILSVLLGYGLASRARHKDKEPQEVTYTSPAHYDSETPVNEDNEAKWHVLYQAKR